MAKKILVVDDEPNILKLVCNRLKAGGYEVISAVDGEQALQTVRNEIPDLIILDLMLPKMHGYEVCKTLKTDEKLKNIPVIMFTAHGDVKDMKEGFDIGADAYLTKPFKPAALMGIIPGLLSE
jgi:DNA-binding response OmpR family regulator